MIFLIFLVAILEVEGKEVKVAYDGEEKEKKGSFLSPHLHASMKVSNLEIDFHIITLM